MNPNEKIVLSLSLLFIISGFFSNHAAGALRRSPVVIAVEKVRPSVVNISTTVKERINPFFSHPGNEFFKDFFPDLFSREYQRTSLGSGVIIDGEKGYIVTNHHVIVSAMEIKVITSDQKEYQARILGSDNRSDLTLLQVETRERLPEVKMGNSDDLMIGETVIAIGNPFGLSHTVTTGVVSALNRSVRSGEHIFRNFIQTDASINPGNSGGPLLNIDGELIGINTAIYQKAQGIGFSIPINKTKRIVRELIQTGEVRFPWLGLEIQEMTDDLKRYFGLSAEKTGILVNDVIQGGPAALAGIGRGDILFSIEGINIASPSDYRETLGEFTASDQIDLKIFRKGQEKTFKVKLGVFPLEQALSLVESRLGIRVAEPEKMGSRRYGVQGGVTITNVRQDSEAGRIGLRSGDLLLKIEDIPINNLEEFKKAISRYHYRSSLNLIVQRGANGYSLTLPF
jgi:serine protease Do